MSSTMRDSGRGSDGSQGGTGSDRSLGELFSEMTSDLTLLLRKELDLAKAETKEELRKAGTAAGAFGGAAFAGYMAVVLLSFAAAWGLAAVIPTGWAFLIVGVLYGIVGAVLFLGGRHRMKQVSPVPEQTVETLKEDVQWAKARKN
jgi:hypothetical protein